MVAIEQDIEGEVFLVDDACTFYLDAISWTRAEARRASCNGTTPAGIPVVYTLFNGVFELDEPQLAYNISMGVDDEFGPLVRVTCEFEGDRIE